MREIVNRLKEACLSILPVVVVVIIFVLAVPGLSVENDGSKFGPVMCSLFISAIPLIIGTALFSIGAEKSVAKIGEVVGTTLTKRKSLTMLLVVAFLMGILATIAEPDLTVLAKRISISGPDWSLILIAAIGVGVFLVMGILRIIYKKKMKYWITIGYLLVFTLALFADESFFSVIFDAGGVTTGVITVPFILSLGIGVSKVLGGENAEDSSFGFSGLCSLGTVLCAMIYCIILKNTGAIENIKNTIGLKFDVGNTVEGLTDEIMIPLHSYGAMGSLYLANFLKSLQDVLISITPIAVFFIFFNFFAKIKGKALASVVVGFIYTFLGMVLFFTGAESGFIPLATSLGKWFGANGNYLWLMFILVAILGFISMLAEPAVRVLAVNVEEVSRGSISRMAIYIILGAATCIALLLNTIRVTYNINYIYFIIPLFLIAIGLSLFSPQIYVGIAIDAAGVATGTMASCFFLPFYIGYTSVIYHGSSSFGESMMRNGFGVVGLMSVMPIISMELVGITADVKAKVSYQKAFRQIKEADDNQVIHLPLEETV